MLEVMSDSVGGQMNGSLSILKTNSNKSSNKSGRDLPQEDININVETLTVCKRKAGAFSSDKNHKLQKVLRQGSPGLHWERKEVPFEHSFNRTIPLSP